MYVRFFSPRVKFDKNDKTILTRKVRYDPNVTLLRIGGVSSRYLITISYFARGFFLFFAPPSPLPFGERYRLYIRTPNEHGRGNAHGVYIICIIGEYIELVLQDNDT